ncbi:hypothetical protein RI129_008110 [Pyrocoelia pectoralis]|uniref:Uncharacterized protein n=1 Tax=Pyrocoelia pectoralis TaxID=417401 RepID=A0AAN7V9L8_9COLE
MEEFLTSFSALEGISIGERRKNLFLLLNKISKDSAMDFKMLIPQTPLEEKFKVETLIHFGKIPDLIEMLRCENPLLIRRILKIPACLETIGSYSDQELLLLFSQVSFNTKQKILSKLPLYIKDQARATKIFDALVNTYGFYLSSKLLPSCNSEVILRSIKENRWIPTCRQLLLLIRYHPNDAEEILKLLLVREKNKDHYNKLLARLAKADLGLLTKLYQTDIPYRAGRRTTRFIVKDNKGAITKEPSLYYKFLHHKEVVKSIGDNFPDMYLQLFPRKIEKFTESLPELLKVLKYRSPKAEILLDTFSKKYDKRLWECNNLMTPEILQLLTVEQRAQLMKPEHKGEMSEDEWMCYLPIDKAIPYLKKRVSLTSDIASRAQLMELLVQTCKLNNSKDALAKLCQYIVSHHRNDHMTVRLAVLRGIRINFGLKHLDEIHWSSIYELMQLFSLNNETFYHFQEFYESYIEFRLSKDLPVRDQLTAWIKAQTPTLNICKGTPLYEKRCLLEFADIIPLTLTDDFQLSHFYHLFLMALIDWNKRHPRDRISLFFYKNAFEYVNTALIGTNNRNFYIANITKYCIQSRHDAEERNELLKLYLAPANKFIDANVLKWLCRKEPQTVLVSLDLIIANLLSTYEITRSPSFWILFRSYSHLELPERIAKICLNSLEDSTDSVRPNSAKALSYLLSPSHFQNLAESYKPLAKAMTDMEKTRYDVWKCLGKCMKNLSPGSPSLNCLLLYANIPKLIQSSLNSIVDNMNESRLMAFFDGLSNCPIQKQVVHLSLRTLDKPHVFKIFSKLMEMAKTKMYKYMLKASIKFFTQNPDVDSWNLLKMTITKIDLKDPLISKILLIKKIPVHYFAAYIVLLWDILCSHKTNVNSNMEHLLDLVTCDNVVTLPKDFCKNIVTQFLFKTEDENLQSSVHSFTCKFLIYCGDDNDTVEIFEIAKDYISKVWCDYDIKRRGFASVNNFVTQFCLEFLNDSSKNLKTFDKFLELWKLSFKPHEAFDEYLHLELTKIYLEKLSLVGNASKFGDLCNTLVDSYGLMVVAVVCDKLVSLLNYFVKSTEEFVEEDRYSVIEALYNSKQTIACYALVILLLNHYPPTLEDTKKQYNSMLVNLKTRDDVVIQFYLHNHFSTVTA